MEVNAQLHASVDLTVWKLGSVLIGWEIGWDSNSYRILWGIEEFLTGIEILSHS
jgi:hypothetical protein